MMKKTTITILFDEEKTSALKLYLEQRGTQIETELAKSLEVLYSKCVPSGVREFIDLRRDKPTKPTEKKARVKPSAQTDSEIRESAEN